VITTDHHSRTPKDVDDMAASLIIEEEFGTTTGYRHPHNGYWAGDFSADWRDTESHQTLH
jgi:hypothetical protein